MIKLHKPLPNTITVGGREFLVKTDFRYWLLFYEIIKQGKTTLQDISFLFEEEIPTQDFSKELMDFFSNPNSTPKSSKGGNDVIDYIEDGEYIYSSFMYAYGIDLLEDNLHWHKFKALVIGLPKDAIMSEIMGYRGYKKDNRKFEKVQEEQKRVWSLPKRKTEENKEIMEEINELFYNA